MRICLTHLRQSIGGGGTERYLNQLATYLCERGHDVTIVCRSHDQSPHPGIRLLALRSFALGPAWRRWAFAKAVERHLRDHRYDVVLGLGRTWSQDIVHIGGGCYQTHLDHYALELSADTTRQTDRRLRPTDRVALSIEARTLRPDAYRRVLVNSNMVKRDVISRYRAPEDAVTVIYHGVDTRLFHTGYRASQGAELRQSLGYAPDDLVFLFLASGFHRKGLDLLLDAFPAVTRQHPRAKLLVVGHDSASGSYRKQAADLGIASQVHFLGRRGDAQLCYAAADVYVLPTRYDAFGLSVLEALATGLPVITTDTCGAAELVEQGVQGSVVSLGRGYAALTQALLDWCDPERVRVASSAARHLAEQHDTLSKFQATERLLEVVAAERRQFVAG